MAPVSDPGNRVLMGTLQVDDDADGNVAGTLPIPSQFQNDGEYEISTTCPDGNVATNVLIVGAGTPSTLAPLPVTGSDSTMDLVRIGVLLLAAGAITLVVVRRRGAATRTSV